MLRLASVALANQTPVGVSRDSIATQSDETWRFVSRSPDALNVRYTSLPPLTVKIKCSPAVGSCTIYSCGRYILL
ncbi:Molybdenum cofactor sulfurase [Trichinella spiralis]|uniref:Molybdenum cofactor sulfurase n=1 Tax=Trichinella spiralis TaxID=6334 RepID=A0ABR3KZ38_TRISP